MKKIKLLTISTSLLLVVLAACEKSELISDIDIEGNYVGTISIIDDMDRIIIDTEEDATANISKIGNKTIRIHFNSAVTDSTFILNYYEDIDGAMVCSTGEDFENMYGHMLGQGHTNGGMMGHMQNDETEWTHHLNDEHQEGDEHFGGFDMLNHTFEYSFKRTVEDITYNMIFQGEKL
ncbi:hypothetical protein [Algibacter luteus]|uniref:hypothetical protein n=1 Tax=Algibacter luteus TaxID=1178825 RepID=UPI0025977FCF|nr:hypothetical protein [Algibacter luteus]WJJ96438.1 hypothetical protein O5O44_14580 [Algibacter luteus]